MPGQERIELDASDIITLLREGELEVEGLLPYSSNYTLLTTVTYNGMSALAVYKPRRGERPLWDFPHGTLYKREVAAYLVSEALEFALVPPTIIRDGTHGVGALQLFIEHDPEAHLFTMQREGLFEAEMFSLAAFDCLINNADRKSGHCLRGRDDRMWAIDHGLTFHSETKLRTVLWDFVGQPFPPHITTALCNFQRCLEQQAPLAGILAELLEPAEMRALQRRVNRMVHAGVYPAPGPGPNVPWPPV